MTFKSSLVSVEGLWALTPFLSATPAPATPLSTHRTSHVTTSHVTTSHDRCGASSTSQHSNNSVVPLEPFAVVVGTIAVADRASNSPWSHSAVGAITAVVGAIDVAEAPGLEPLFCCDARLFTVLTAGAAGEVMRPGSGGGTGSAAAAAAAAAGSCWRAGRCWSAGSWC